MKVIPSILLGVSLLVANQCLGAEKTQPGLLGEYYAIDGAVEDFPSIGKDKKPALKRVDPTINIEATTEALPGTQLEDHFYIRWTGKLRVPNDGKYTFFLESDDGSRLFIDGKQVVDNGGLHPMEEKDGSAELKPGDHDLKIEFFENEGDAGIKFSWQPPGKDKQVVPSSVLFTPAASEPAEEVAGKPGLSAEYFDLGVSIEDFPSFGPEKKPTIKRVDKNINFESTQDAWPGTQLLDHFYIRWTGKLHAPTDGHYVFYLESDDGSRMFIDGKKVVDNGGDHPMEEKDGDIELKAGDHALKVEFYENEVDAGIKFSWKPPGKEKEIVPEKALSH